MNRQPKGIPIGGEFAALDRAESAVELDDDTYDEGYDDLPEPGPVTFVLPTSKLAEALSRIEKANKRLARAGVEERFIVETEEGVRQTRGGVTVGVVEVTIQRPRIGVDGHRVVGVFDFTPDGDPVPAFQADGDVAPPASPHCEQCGTTRRRERIFVIRDEDGAEKVVGRSCLAPYLGIRPEGLWALEFDPGALSDDAGDSNDEFHLGDGLAASRSDIVYDVEDFLITTVAVADSRGGFVSRSAATRENPATVDLIGDTVNTEGADPAHRARAAEILDWVRTIDPDKDGEYLAKLHQVLIGSTGSPGRFLKRKHAAVAASAVSAFERAQRDAARAAVVKEAARTYTPGFVAPVKEKIAQVPATVEHVFHGENNFGYRPTPFTRVSMITGDGKRMVWFASSYKELEIGQKVTVAATVKGHEQREFDDQMIDQTMLTRAKLTDPESGELVG